MNIRPRKMVDGGLEQSLTAIPYPSLLENDVDSGREFPSLSRAMMKLSNFFRLYKEL